jgi:hypothetical protein
MLMSHSLPGLQSYFGSEKKSVDFNVKASPQQKEKIINQMQERS